MPGREREAKRLEVFNALALPLLRAARRLRRVWSTVSRPGSLQVYTERGHTVAAIVVDLPASRPLVAALYASTQESRPISPSQLQRKLAQVRKLLAKMSGKAYASADIVVTVYAPRGFTSGAKRLARRASVNLATTPTEALKGLTRYIAVRLQRLADRLRGKRVWGQLPLLLYGLQELHRELAGGGPTLLEPHRAIELAEKGGTIG